METFAPQPEQSSPPKQAPEDSSVPYRIELYNESLYQNEAGDLVLDVIAGQLAFIDVILVDQENLPIPGKSLLIQSSRSSPMVGARRETDQDGGMQFAVRPAQAGEDWITVAWQDAKYRLMLNVISDEALQWRGVDELEGVVRWETFLESRVTYLEEAIRIDFSEGVKALNGQKITVVGFMMPLESMSKQKHFLLVSTPPSCFFHLPGGPVGAIEVFTDKGVDMHWEPVRVEGHFELFAPKDYGAVYRLTKAALRPLDS